VAPPKQQAIAAVPVASAPVQQGSIVCAYGHVGDLHHRAPGKGMEGPQPDPRRARMLSSLNAADEGAAHQEEDRAGRDHLRMPSPSELRPRVRQADGRAVLASASSTPDRSAHCRGPSVNRSQLGSTVVNLVHPASTEGASARIRRSGLQVREASCGRRCATSGGHRRLRGEGARPCRWSVAAAPRGCPADAAQGRWRRR